MKSSAKLTLLSMWKGISLLFLISLMAVGTYFFESQKNSHLEREPSFKKAICAQFLNLPIHFEKNEGQIDASFQYLARCPGHLFYFAPNEVFMFLQGKQNALSALKLQFVGANPHSIIQGMDGQEGKANYFIGNDPAKWHSSISTYAKITYQDLYPGIDAVFYGNAKQLEYDLCVAPGINPNNIRLQIEGARELSINEKGDLNITVEDGQRVQMKKPLIYQIVDGNKVDVLGEFVLLARNEIGFALNDYDLSRTLVIDPILVYSTYLGGSGNDSAFGIAVDNNRNVYVTGFTNSTNFPVTAGSFQTTYQGGASDDVFVTKLNSNGSSLIYSTYLGGSNQDRGRGIAVDSSGNAYITGFTFSFNFPTTAGAFRTSLQGALNAFVTKLNATGTALIYSTYLGGIANFATAIAINDSGNAYITGTAIIPNFPTTPGAFQTAPLGADSAFVAKLSNTGASLVYSTYLAGQTTGRSIVLDSNENVYVTGVTTSLNLPVTPGAFQTVRKGSQDAFVASFNPSGTALNFCTYLGGSGFGFIELGLGIDIDSSSNVYVTGVTNSSDFPVTPNAFQMKLNGTTNAFITKLSATGTTLLYSTYLGGNNQDTGIAIKVDNNDNIYITGSTNSTNFPVTSNAAQSSLSGSLDAFITKLSPSTSTLIYSTLLGGNASDSSETLAIDSNGNAYIAGSTGSFNFPVTAGAFQTTYGGGTADAFIAKFAIGTPLVTSVSPNVGPVTGGTPVTITGTNFTSASAVFFGTTAATTFLVNSDTQITAVSPAHAAGTVDITVQAAGGTSAITAADQFTYQLIPTTTTLSVSPNPALVGQTVTLTATVSPSATGSVSFFDGGTFIGSASIFNGTAVLTSSFFSAGNHSLTAVYSGNNTFASSTSESVILTVNLVETITTLSVSPNPARRGQTVTLTATVIPSSATGSVIFLADNQLVGVARLINGQATLTTSFSHRGEKLIVASYSGDNQFLGSISDVVVLKVGRASVPPPRKLIGFKKAEGLQIVNVLKWKAPKHDKAIVAYHIYRGSLNNQIGTVTNLQHLRFKDRHVKADKTYTYYVVSVDEFGNTSQPAKVVIRGFAD
jgi:hypothetical protein